jgi:hypothetical protein
MKPLLLSSPAAVRSPQSAVRTLRILLIYRKPYFVKRHPILITKKGTRSYTKYSDLLLFFLSRADCSRLFPLWLGSNHVSFYEALH